MRWTLSEEQVAYQAALRDWLAHVAPSSVVREWLDDGDATGFEQRLLAEGWTGVGIPEHLGGQEGGLLARPRPRPGGLPPPLLCPHCWGAPTSRLAHSRADPSCC